MGLLICGLTHCLRTWRCPDFWSLVYSLVYSAETGGDRQTRTSTGTALKCLLHIPIASPKEPDEEPMRYLGSSARKGMEVQVLFRAEKVLTL